YNKLNCYDFIVSNNFYLLTQKLKSLYFLCDNYSDEFKNLLDNSPIKYKVFLYNDIFEIMKEKELYPITTQLSKNKNTYLKNIKLNLIKMLNGVKFRDCFFSGIALCFLSIIVPFSLYYLIMGSIFLILSIISLIYKSMQKKENYVLNNINLIDILNNK
ncbi:MAG: hypothetical protein IJX17_01555, partial [Clostridia bacterium]|nr:hypothetical protein [Clostridia bacterium]